VLPAPGLLGSWVEASFAFGQVSNEFPKSVECADGMPAGLLMSLGRDTRPIESANPKK